MGQDDQIRQGEAADVTPAESAFDRLQAQDIRRERRIFWSEVATVAFLGVVVVVYLMVR
jgi:hypothetical protein